MDNKFTKGKWSVVNYSHCIAIETKLDNGQEHTVFTDQFCYASKFDGNAKANALLISKAPELLEALIIAHKFIEENKLKNYMIELLNRQLPNLEQLIKEATEL